MLSKNLTVDRSQILIFGGYVQVRESLDILTIFWVNIILNHIVARVIWPRYEGSCVLYRSKSLRKEKYCQIPISYWYQKKCEILQGQGFRVLVLVMMICGLTCATKNVQEM